MNTILVIEDEQPLLQAIKLKLEKSGFNVLSARAVEQALEYLKEMPNIAAIWLDHYLLGKENGLDLVTKLKTPGSPFGTIPIFVVSNTASPEKVQSYIRLGVSKFYVKAETRLDEVVAEISDFVHHEHHESADPAHR